MLIVVLPGGKDQNTTLIVPPSQASFDHDGENLFLGQKIEKAMSAFKNAKTCGSPLYRFDHLPHN